MNKIKLSMIFALLVCFGVSGNIRAMEFHIIDQNAISMGGACVAASSGSFAPYCNPATLTNHKTGFEMVMGAGVGVREINLADHIDKLSDIKLDNLIDFTALQANSYTINAGNPTINNALPASDWEKIKTIKKELISLSDKNALHLMPSASLGVQVGDFGFGFFSLSEISAFAVINKNKLDVIVKKTKAPDGTLLPTPTYIKYNDTNNSFTLSDSNAYTSSSLEYALDNQETYLQVRGLSYAEVPISYAKEINSDFGSLSIGGTFKIMPGYTYDKKIKIDTKSGDIDDEFKGNEQQDTAFGVDLGLLYAPKTFDNSLLAGLVVKNINSPQFSFKNGGDITVKPQVRAGLAYNLWDETVTIASDFDLTNNETLFNDYNSQYFGVGIRYAPTNWASFRGGLKQNIKQSDDGIIYTGGLALGLKWLKIDLAAEYSSEKGMYDGNEIPRYGKVQVALVSNLFYGSKESKKTYEKEPYLDDSLEQSGERIQKPIQDEVAQEMPVQEKTPAQIEQEEIPSQFEQETMPKQLVQRKMERKLSTMEPQELKQPQNLNAAAKTSPPPVVAGVQKVDSKKADKGTPCPTNNAGQEKIEKAAISAALNNWAGKWSSMDINGYLSMYASDFRPTNMTRKAWEENRRKMLKKNYIKVKLVNPSIKFTSCTTANVNFEQVYESKGYKDYTIKSLVFKKTDTGWLIISETSKNKQK